MKILIIALIVTLVLGFILSMAAGMLTGDPEKCGPIAESFGYIAGWLIKIIVLLAAIQFIVGLFR